MKSETWQALEAMFSMHPIMRSEAVSYEEIDTAFEKFDFVLDADYREFIHRYGGAVVGPFPIFGLRKAMPMGKDENSFLDVTQTFRRQGWPGVEKWAIISTDHSGNPVGLDVEGKLWIYDHDARTAQVIATNFENYLRMKCLNLPDSK